MRVWKRGYKLILRYSHGGVRFANEFYDLKADPRETTNLCESPQQKIVKQVTAQLNEFFTKYTVPAHDGLHLEDQPMATPASPCCWP
ncbi:hypothetical protein GCM10011507_27660 [Edaphobacter acidisoli]|uniref:N-sulphoglucosamine sulphohydrolase C-terminal domain-containing protein n=1 Tax=Edaphobacter acidisoli TaxID=2040573 RepID=A0A916RXZ5_9BACT|nr:hypothetical protein [Edaphobacter acidisoli]GGA74731.1 hypothetical protein GCM10011507_27660 [Edaphobacter acidisoli]